mmetsp:Transcript_13672/g.39438  ORF Transcript_13672/g.39438 Transcript_13672/m.39438 type:complete len:116 (+) Transcript_13672:1673-2020(+)
MSLNESLSLLTYCWYDQTSQPAQTHILTLTNSTHSFHGCYIHYSDLYLYLAPLSWPSFSALSAIDLYTQRRIPTSTPVTHTDTLRPFMSSMQKTDSPISDTSTHSFSSCSRVFVC